MQRQAAAPGKNPKKVLQPAPKGEIQRGLPIKPPVQNGIPPSQITFAPEQVGSLLQPPLLEEELEEELLELEEVFGQQQIVSHAGLEQSTGILQLRFSRFSIPPVHANLSLGEQPSLQQINPLLEEDELLELEEVHSQ